jgi:glycosyltransferase family protein
MEKEKRKVILIHGINNINNIKGEISFKKNKKLIKKNRKKHINLSSKFLIIIILSILVKIILFRNSSFSYNHWGVKQHEKEIKKEEINMEYYNYCQNCVKNSSNPKKQCSNCTDEILFYGLNIVSTEDTLNEIIENKKSISRFGDGEMFLILGYGIYFQNANKKLAKRLLEIINNNSTNKNLLVGINFFYKKKDFDKYSKGTASYWRSFFYHYRHLALKVINKNTKYYSSWISRFYTTFRNKSHVPFYVKKLKKLWENRDIIVVEGEKTRNGIGNDLFNNAKSIKRIICPAQNSFKFYDKILNAVLTVDKNNLILISLGPTASVLACDLSKLGYQAVDISHTNVQYESFLNDTRNMTQIYGKNGNTEENYNKQIILKIFN